MISLIDQCADRGIVLGPRIKQVMVQRRPDVRRHTVPILLRQFRQAKVLLLGDVDKPLLHSPNTPTITDQEPDCPHR